LYLSNSKGLELYINAYRVGYVIYLYKSLFTKLAVAKKRKIILRTVIFVPQCLTFIMVTARLFCRPAVIK